MESEKQVIGAKCSEEGWMWRVDGRQSSVYKESQRIMNMRTRLDEDGKPLEVFVSTHWVDKDMKSIPASADERIMVCKRVQLVIDSLALRCSIKFE